MEETRSLSQPRTRRWGLHKERPKIFHRTNPCFYRSTVDSPWVTPSFSLFAQSFREELHLPISRGHGDHLQHRYRLRMDPDSRVTLLQLTLVCTSQTLPHWTLGAKGLCAQAAWQRCWAHWRATKATQNFGLMGWRVSSKHKQMYQNRSLVSKKKKKMYSSNWSHTHCFKPVLRDHLANLLLTRKSQNGTYNSQFHLKDISKWVKY